MACGLLARALLVDYVGAGGGTGTGAGTRSASRAAVRKAASSVPTLRWQVNSGWRSMTSSACLARCACDARPAAGASTSTSSRSRSLFASHRARATPTRHPGPLARGFVPKRTGTPLVNYKGGRVVLQRGDTSLPLSPQPLVPLLGGRVRPVHQGHGRGHHHRGSLHGAPHATKALLPPPAAAVCCSPSLQLPPPGCRRPLPRQETQQRSCGCAISCSATAPHPPVCVCPRARASR